MQPPAIVTREAWLEARRALLAKEKALTRQRDALMQERRAMPWVRIEKQYEFDAPEGNMTLSDLFDGRSQLIAYHFMFAPDWEEGCVGCSFGCDHVDAARQHFEHNDLSYAAVSRAPIAKLEAYRKRMGWGFRWVSSGESDFNFDFHVSFTPDQLAAGKGFYNFEETRIDMSDLPGVSVFYKDEAGDIFHTWSSYGRGDENALGAYAYLDMAPKGRNENGPNYNLTDWVRRHDQYAAPAGGCCANGEKA